MLPYLYGEAVVQLRFETRLIGHVKLSGLPIHMVQVLIHKKIKTGPVLEMTFSQEDATVLESYRSFACGNPSEVYGVGAAEPYDNARSGYGDLLIFFNQHSRVAGVWRHDEVPWILLLYSSMASAFAEKGFPSSPGLLSLIACKRVPWHDTPMAPSIEHKSLLTSAHTSIGNGITALKYINATGVDADTDDIALPEATRPALPSDVLEAKDSSDTNYIRSDTRSSNALVQIEATENESMALDQPGSLSEKKKNLTFEMKYSITFPALKRIPASVKTTPLGNPFNHDTAHFFLAFHSDNSAEEIELKAWLSTRTPAYTIFSASEEHGWDRFKVDTTYVSPGFLHANPGAGRSACCRPCWDYPSECSRISTGSKWPSPLIIVRFTKNI